MAGQRLTDKSALNNHTGTGDLYMVVDVSDTTGSSAGTSKKIDSKFVIQTDKISVSASATQSLKTTPVTLVSSPGSGYAVIPLCFTLFNTYSSTESAKVPLLFGHTGSNDSTLACATITNYMKDVTTNATFITSPSMDIPMTKTTSIDNTPLYVSAAGNYSGGFSIDIYVTYQIIQLT
jgi:hypothetical protein